MRTQITRLRSVDLSRPIVGHEFFKLAGQWRLRLDFENELVAVAVNDIIPEAVEILKGLGIDVGATA